ncbi:hypothetical protein FRB90_003864 [Tulasnella sp. 427]|nr:hypothetical protein FRB90_003864 [Tulasnella sp. 427]
MDLPEDVLLDIFTCMDFSAIVALRQTCRACYHVSKTTALWLNIHQWITENSEDWRTSLARSRSTLSASELEKQVARMVSFERNWSRGERGVQRTILLPQHHGFPLALVPGGRGLLAWDSTDTGGVVYYDLDADVQETGRTLIPVEHGDHDQLITSYDLATNELAETFEFYLAIEFQTADQLYRQSRKPRKLTVWRVTTDENGLLQAELVRSIAVFRLSPPQNAVSLAGDFVLRMSIAGTSESQQVFTVHRWKGLEGDEATHSILVPKRREYFWTTGRAALLHDGRILSISASCVEIYPPADIPWKESLNASMNIPETSPQWVYECPPHYHLHNYSVSRPFHVYHTKSTTFSLYTGEFLLSFRIPRLGGSEPIVTTVELGDKHKNNRISLGTSRAALTKLKQTEATFVTLDFHPGMCLWSEFAGVGCDGPEPGGAKKVTETQFKTPYPSSANPWFLDEESGRIFCTLSKKELQYTVLCFVD